MPVVSFGELPPTSDLPSLDDLELSYIEAVLHRRGGDKRAAAATLGVSLKTIYNKLARIDVRRDREGGDRP